MEVKKLSFNDNMAPNFFKLIDEIPTLNNCFTNVGIVSTVYTHPTFIKWKESLKYEIRKFKQDSVTTELLNLLDSFNGYSDQKMLTEVRAKCEVIQEHFAEYSERNDSEGKIVMNQRKVFIVHGHDTQIRDNVELFLRRLELEPVILANEPNGGRTIIQKFTDNSDVSFAIILYTACDEGRAKGTDSLKGRARQNVIFEHGYFYSKLGCRNVVALYEPGVEIPSDLAGVLYIPLNSDWKRELKKELKAANIDADWTKG